MGMLDRAVFVSMCVWFAWRVSQAMCVPVVLIMGVGMRMHRKLVDVLMLMMFRGMQPDAQSHKSAGYEEARGNRITKRHDGDDRAKERCGRKVGARSRSTQLTQYENIKHKANAVSEKANDRRKKQNRR